MPARHAAAVDDVAFTPCRYARMPLFERNDADERVFHDVGVLTVTIDYEREIDDDDIMLPPLTELYPQ